MTSYYHYNAQVAHVASVSHTHGGHRSRRAVPRLSVSQSQNVQRQFRGGRTMKDLIEPASLSVFRVKFEAGRSFELEDDMEFCPSLLTESDLAYMSASERSSLASNSPDSSPTQQPQTVATGTSLNSSTGAFASSFQSHHSSPKLFQPAATRGRNAIPIINPVTGISMSSPPPSVSPATLQNAIGRRW
ncbi:hypothetical protein E4U14_003941 [Claviceps sp. LM454 group G7]|nr:hypothetical protein E4U14_003941 [Claviceps sp. LM454 group G7]